MKAQKAPAHLSKESKDIWNLTVFEYHIPERAQLEILKVSLEALDRAQACRKQIKKDGMTVKDRTGGIKAHPLIVAEQTNRAAFLRGIKDLNLDYEEQTRDSIGRPPRR